MNFFNKLFNFEGREVNKYKKRVDIIKEKADSMRSISDDKLQHKTVEFKKRIKEGESPDNLIEESFAVVYEACRRFKKRKHKSLVRGQWVEWYESFYDVQVMGALVLWEGKIAEMKTGEGKTLAKTMPLYLGALTSRPVYTVTVNDYLSTRDAEWHLELFKFLGLKVGVINSQNVSFTSVKPANAIASTDEEEQESPLYPCSRKEAYQTDIVFGTNNEYGFDYLRDNMRDTMDKKAQKELYFAIVDEVDSVLIDEARTPLIISAPDTESAKLYARFAQIVPRLKENEDYNVDIKSRSAFLSPKGIKKLEDILNIDNMYSSENIRYVHHLEQALKAHAIFKRDVDYMVRDGKVIIVDNFTGRLMPGRRFSEGLHQALEAKENVTVEQESRTLASITFQNYFRLFDKIAGMTGTAITSAEEFQKVYELEVVQIPTNKPIIRKDKPDVIYKSEDSKFNAIVKKVKESNKVGRPVLIGTIAIEKSEALSQYLKADGIKHEVLNAKYHEKEATIVTNAGQKGAVTIATNMAGRGTDIKLADGVKELGGLLIIATERHEARRIDNQLRGRSGRQGDPGETQFFVSLEDELMRRFGFDKSGMMNMLLDKLPEGQPIENKMVSNALEKAQQRIEGFNFDSRKHVLEYDDVLNKQRMAIYRRRDKIIKESTEEKRSILLKRSLNSVKQFIKNLLNNHYNTKDKIINVKEIIETMKAVAPISDDIVKKIEDEGENRDEKRMYKLLYDYLNNRLTAKQERIEVKKFNHLAKTLYLRIIDNLWQQHLESMEYMRLGIKWQGYGQRDPLVEYKNRGYDMYKQLLAHINAEYVNSIYKAEIREVNVNDLMDRYKNMNFKSAKDQATDNSQPDNDKKTTAKPLRSSNVGRNDPCPCGSGKKYKKCHGKQ